MQNPPDFYVAQALEMGAEHAVLFELKDIIFEEREILAMNVAIY
jgi:hypothetical protein